MEAGGLPVDHRVRRVTVLIVVVLEEQTTGLQEEVVMRTKNLVEEVQCWDECLAVELVVLIDFLEQVHSGCSEVVQKEEHCTVTRLG